MTIIQDLGRYEKNRLFMKREDLIPFSFGGNKARKAKLFFQEIDKGDYDSVVTYGSGSSNHCRIVANACCKRGIKCHIISPEEASEPTFNRQMMELFDAEITTVPVREVHQTLEDKIAELRSSGKKPYFIEGGGHGNIGTEAYVECYQEIKDYEAEHDVHFDYIFFASGTGTTHAGLVCGQILCGDERKIIGISIARKNPRGRDVVLDSIRSYLIERAKMAASADVEKSADIVERSVGANKEYRLGAADRANIVACIADRVDKDKGPDRLIEAEIQEKTIFVDDYTSGYGNADSRVIETIARVLRLYGIPLDATYTGKAFMGMTEYITKEHISAKNILFIHTGGTPLFFDVLKKMSEGR